MIACARVIPLHIMGMGKGGRPARLGKTDSHWAARGEMDGEELGTRHPFFRSGTPCCVTPGVRQVLTTEQALTGRRL